MSASTPNDADKAHAEHLKAEGNTLYIKRQHTAAYIKYSQAIERDPGNPVLWSNRAATCLAMKRYVDATHDAQKATKLDPTYLKAWARLGTAQHNLNAWIPSMEAWRSALENLPTDRPLTDQEKSFKIQFEEGLQKAKNALTTSRGMDAGTFRGKDETPWAKAFALENELRASGQTSSAFVIMDAYNKWDEAIKIMTALQHRKINGQMCMTGSNGGLAALSDAILCDPRVFHISRNDFLEIYNRQVIFESKQFAAWQTGGPEVIKKEVLQRLQQFGWDNVRRALSVTIRAWILRGFIELKVQNAYGDWLERAIEMLEWGRKTWKNIPREQRGEIFEDTFLLGVRRLHITGLVSSLGYVGQADIVPEERLQKIKETANAILQETEGSEKSDFAFGPGGTAAFGSWASCWLYPRGEALAALGWHGMRIGDRKQLPIEKRMKHYMEAAGFYTDAAQSLPKDDETHLMYRYTALEGLWFSKAPLSITLPYAREMGPLVPGIKKIWSGSPEFQQMLDQAEGVKEFVEQAQRSIDKGDFTLDTAAYPEFVTKALAA